MSTQNERELCAASGFTDEKILEAAEAAGMNVYPHEYPDRKVTAFVRSLLSPLLSRIAELEKLLKAESKELIEAIEERDEAIRDRKEVEETHREDSAIFQSRIDALSKDAERYRWLRDSPTWSIDFYKSDGSKFTSADRFAAAFSRNQDDCIPHWSVEFNTPYGAHEDHDDLDQAIDAAISAREGE